MGQQGKFISFLCITLIIAVVVSIFYFVAGKGFVTFSKDKINMFDFSSGTNWDPSNIDAGDKPVVRALPMTAGSFIVTFLSTIVTTPFAIGAAVSMAEISPKKGTKFLQPVIELPVGIPSVVHGFTGLSIIVPFVRLIFGRTGFGILAGASVLPVTILPMVTTTTADALKAVSRHYREASLALSATYWQTIYKIVLRTAVSGILIAVIFDVARALGEALTIQMIIGNAAVMLTSLTTPASTLTDILTVGIRNTIMGTIENNVFWFLALILLLISLLFNIVIRIIGRRGASK